MWSAGRIIIDDQEETPRLFISYYLNGSSIHAEEPSLDQPARSVQLKARRKRRMSQALKSEVDNGARAERQCNGSGQLGPIIQFLPVNSHNGYKNYLPHNYTCTRQVVRYEKVKISSMRER